MGDVRDPARDQPLPTPGQTNVQEALAAALLERMQYGIEKYGSPLETFNGRDPIRDVWEELVDALTYMTQVRLERGDILPGMKPGATVRTAGLTEPVVRCSSCGGVRTQSAAEVAERLQGQGWVLDALRQLCETGATMIPVNLVKAVLNGDLTASGGLT